MIEITENPGDGNEDGAYRLNITGHAGFESSGKDIVCAAVSALSYTWLNELEKLQRNRHVSGVAYRIGPEGIDASWYGEDTVFLGAYETVQTGFRMLAENFSEYITLKRGEKEKAIC